MSSPQVEGESEQLTGLVRNLTELYKDQLDKAPDGSKHPVDDVLALAQAEEVFATLSSADNNYLGNRMYAAYERAVNKAADKVAQGSLDDPENYAPLAGRALRLVREAHDAVLPVNTLKRHALQKTSA